MSITSSNAIYTLNVAGLNAFPGPVQLQQFSAEDIFGTDPISSAEVQMGVDGNMTAGFIFTPKPQQVSLMADSPSNAVFDAWYAQEEQAGDKLEASGIIILPAVRKQYTMVTGFLTSYPPLPNAGRVLQPRRFAITWSRINPANI